MSDPEDREDRESRTAVLEAFADTIIPGEKRHPGDRAVAGVSTDGGAVASGAIDVLETPEGGMAPALDDLARALDGHAVRFRAEHGLPPDDREPFVGLGYADRLTLVGELLAPDHPERVMWAGLAMFSFMAFDTGAHLHTVDAIASGHPGLRILGFAPPDKDGLWRFPSYSYGRRLADIHPDTDRSGSPA
ncbi:DUF5987 family protein [Streptomyces sp. NPDC049954]|uniref:DUF5987 family protein n=1 Tax=Streptomyces sp. NPDC049954 TaxID=3155779 RepID=UPI003433FA73